MDSNKKTTGQDWWNQDTQGLMSKFVSNTSNNTPENNFQTGLNAVGSFAANTIDSGLGDWRSDHKENLITGAGNVGLGFTPIISKKEKPAPKKENNNGEVNEDELLDSSGASGGNGVSGGGVGEITTQKQRIDAFLGLGDPDRIAKRTEIKSARKENRATNRLRRAGEENYTTTSVDKDTGKETTTTGAPIPTRKDARKAKKARIKAAKVKSDNKVVEKNKAKPETKKETKTSE